MDVVDRDLAVLASLWRVSGSLPRGDGSAAWDLARCTEEALAFQDLVNGECPLKVCAVCSMFVKTRDISDYVSPDSPLCRMIDKLLRKDLPSDPDFPRDGLTGTVPGDQQYCLQGIAIQDSAQGSAASVCKDCAQNLMRSTIPDCSLVAFDAGDVPSSLPPLTMVETWLVAPQRAVRPCIVFK